MSAESKYISGESKNIIRTVEMLEDLTGKRELTRYEVIALGKLLQDVYTGIERILRTLLEERGIKARKSEDWHKQLLLAAREQSLVSEAEGEVFRNLLLFRHMEVHGYGFMLDEKRLRQLAEPVPGLCRSFLKKIEGLNSS